MTSIKDLRQIMAAFGFDGHESSVYSTLLEHGRLPARRVSYLSKVPRVQTYQAIDRLGKKGIVQEFSDQKVATFEAVSPDILSSLIATRAREMESQRQGLERMLPLLTAAYSRGLRRPSVSFSEGIEGFRKIYEEILNDGKDVRVIASSLKVPAYQKVIAEHKIKQEKEGISHFALVPRSNDPERAAAKSSKKAGAVNKHIKALLEEDLVLEGQMLIFGDKVAITHFTGEASHVVIENKHIAKMFRQVFAFMWSEYNKKFSY